jgi:hypothetical protein
MITSILLLVFYLGVVSAVLKLDGGKRIFG